MFFLLEMKDIIIFCCNRRIIKELVYSSNIDGAFVLCRQVLHNFESFVFNLFRLGIH